MAERLAGYFVTGTDTGVGKTLVSQILLHRLRREGRRVIGFKPVASGCEQTVDGLRNADALALQQASSVALPYAQINPYAYAPPIAPHLAAAAQDERIELARIQTCLNQAAADYAVVEGVGGWLVPLNDRESVADLAALLQLPVILVVGLRLGCLNHARLSLAAMRAQGVEIAGWVANSIDRDFAFPEANVQSLCSWLDCRLLARLPWLTAPPDAADLQALAKHFEL